MGHAEKLACDIEDAVIRALDGHGRAGILFSGGVDSGLLAHIARKHCDIGLYVTGFPGSPDVVWAREAAEIMGMPITEIIIDAERIDEAARAIACDIGMLRAEWLTPFVPLYIAMEGVDETLVLCGQGADELFGGYRKYRDGIDNRFAELMMARDLENLISSEVPHYRMMASVLGKSVAFPFLDEELVAAGLSLPFDALISEADGKLALRDAARHMGLPEEIAGRPKKAIQYGTRASREIKKLARSRGQSLEEYLASFTVI